MGQGGSSSAVNSAKRTSSTTFSTFNSTTKVVLANPGAKQETSHAVIICNHMENNYHLSNKKALYYNMKIYFESIGKDWWKVIPLTFHIKEGVGDKEFAKFEQVFKGNEGAEF